MMLCLAAWSYHVEVGQGGHGRPEYGARLDRLEPQEECEEESEDGDAFVVVGARHRAGDVAGDDGDEACREKASTSVPYLPGQQERCDGRQPTGGRYKQQQ